LKPKESKESNTLFLKIPKLNEEDANLSKDSIRPVSDKLV
jgi:hypothetical protein